MGTVEVKTADAMQAIADASIVSGSVNSGTGHLTLTKSGGGTIDAGNVVGPTGATGATGAKGNTGNTGAQGASGFVVGAVVMYINATAPTGWKLCNGNGISRTTFAALFAIIGTTYGAGDGSTTFNVPNMQAKFPRQDTANLAGVQNSSTHDHQIDGGTTTAVAHLTLLSGAGPNVVIDKVATTPNWTATDQATTTAEGSSTGTRTQGTRVTGQTNTADHTPPYLNFNFIICTG